MCTFPHVVKRGNEHLHEICLSTLRSHVQREHACMQNACMYTCYTLRCCCFFIHTYIGMCMHLQLKYTRVEALMQGLHIMEACEIIAARAETWVASKCVARVENGLRAVGLLNACASCTQHEYVRHVLRATHMRIARFQICNQRELRAFCMRPPARYSNCRVSRNETVTGSALLHHSLTHDHTAILVSQGGVAARHMAPSASCL